MTLDQDGKDSEFGDGMDLGICYLPATLDETAYVGARTELFVAENGSISEIRNTNTGFGRHRSTTRAIKPAGTTPRSSNFRSAEMRNRALGRQSARIALTSEA